MAELEKNAHVYCILNVGKSQNKCAYHNNNKNSFLSLNLLPFLFRPILNPWPSQCMPFFVTQILPSKTKDMLKIGISQFSTKNSYYRAVSRFKKISRVWLLWMHLLNMTFRPTLQLLENWWKERVEYHTNFILV